MSQYLPRYIFSMFRIIPSKISYDSAGHLVPLTQVYTKDLKDFVDLSGNKTVICIEVCRSVTLHGSAIVLCLYLKPAVVFFCMALQS